MKNFNQNMKNFLLAITIALGLTQITQAQVACDMMNLIVNVGSVPDYVNIYHPGHYLTSPQEDNVIEWVITNEQGNVVVEETLIDDSILAFNHNVPITETMNVSAVLTNATAGVACLIEDVLYWEETEVIPGTFTYSWAFLYGNVGTLGINGFTPTPLRVYPNPSNDLINISLDNDQLLKVELYSLTGGLLFKIDVHANTYTLDIADYPTGAYLMRVFSQNHQIINSKIVKK